MICTEIKYCISSINSLVGNKGLFPLSYIQTPGLLIKDTRYVLSSVVLLHINYIQCSLEVHVLCMVLMRQSAVDHICFRSFDVTFTNDLHMYMRDN